MFCKQLFPGFAVVLLVVVNCSSYGGMVLEEEKDVMEKGTVTVVLKDIQASTWHQWQGKTSCSNSYTSNERICQVHEREW